MVTLKLSAKKVDQLYHRKSLIMETSTIEDFQFDERKLSSDSWCIYFDKSVMSAASRDNDYQNKGSFVYYIICNFMEASFVRYILLSLRICFILYFICNFT